MKYNQIHVQGLAALKGWRGQEQLQQHETENESNIIQLKYKETDKHVFFSWWEIQEWCLDKYNFQIKKLIYKL